MKRSRAIFPKEKEAPIVKAIKQYLDLMEKLGKLYYVRVGTGSFQAKSGAWFITGRKGTPDFCICVDGLFVGAEIKAPTGKQSPDQRIAEEAIIKSGGQYFIVHSVDEMKKVVDNILGRV